MPAATPIKKKQIINNGLVSNQLSKRNPIVDPTNTAATNSVPIFKALPKDAAFEPLFFSSPFLIFFFAISKRVDIFLKLFIFYEYLKSLGVTNEVHNPEIFRQPELPSREQKILQDEEKFMPTRIMDFTIVSELRVKKLRAKYGSIQKALESIGL